LQSRHNFALICTQYCRTGLAGGVMISGKRYGEVLLLILAAGMSVASGRTAVALEVAEVAAPGEDAEAEDAVDANTEMKDVDIMKDVDVAKLDWSQLNIDASTLTNPTSKARPASKARSDNEATWSSKDKPNGSAALTVKQSLSPFWDARVGADLTVAHEPSTPTTSEVLSEKLANGGSLPQSSGTAWAAITAPGVGSIWDKTAIEARLDPLQDQSKLGTSLSKSLPLSEQYSLTLQNGYNIVQQGLVSVPGIPGHPTRNFETEQTAKLSITETGTSFIAGQTLSSADDKWLRKIGAEQKLFGDVNIAGTIGETPYGVTNKSLTAGFKRSW
jgi:hypothetical protein